LFQNPGASINIEIAGTSNSQFSTLAIIGLANLAGTLNANFLFVPNVGDSFPIITYASRTGSFNAVNAINLPPGRTLNPVYNPTNFTLVTASAAAATSAALPESPPFAYPLRRPRLASAAVFTVASVDVAIESWDDSRFGHQRGHQQDRMLSTVLEDEELVDQSYIEPIQDGTDVDVTFTTIASETLPWLFW
jgi:hypothetical protein